MPFRSVARTRSLNRDEAGPVEEEDGNELDARVHIDSEDNDALAALHRAITNNTIATVKSTQKSHYDEPHTSLREFLEDANRALEEKGQPIGRLGVCFRDVTTWGAGGGNARVKTMADAVWRTVIFRDVYEWTLKRWFFKEKVESGRPLIRDFSGVCRPGEMMLVLGRPGSGCSTFLRTIGNQHSSFLGVTGSIDYSGISPAEIQKKYRGEVAYVPEEDRHYPTLTVRQALEFALQSKTPKREWHRIQDILELYCRVFGVKHILDSIIGNEYIRGISGGERKRVSILESLCAGASVESWDNSTRGLDAASALDYARSLRIMTDTCEKATFVSLYQVSESVYHLMDKVLVIDGGRMIYQGPADQARRYFEGLGYEPTPGQRTADFITAVTSPEERRFKPGWEARTPKGPEELEAAFRRSAEFRELEKDIRTYEEDLRSSDAIASQGSITSSEHPELEKFRESVRSKKSRTVSESSNYNTSFVRQVMLCTKRQWWLLKGDYQNMLVRLGSCIVNGLIIGSMFYGQPQTSDGVFSRGGFLFYSAVLVAWTQLVEVEDATMWREIITRQKQFAFVRPSAVAAAKIVTDLFVIAAEVILYSIVAYFLAGLRMSADAFFLFLLFQYLCSIAMTALYRLFSAFSPTYEVAIRYCGAQLLVGIIFGGYMLNLESLIRDAPWVGWLAYTTPFLYTYESMMAAEFHALNFTCSPHSVIPSGPEFTATANQACAYRGSVPGETWVNGDAYLDKAFQFTYSHVWRNFGILMLFTVAFILIQFYLCETIDWESSGNSALEFKDAESAGTKPSEQRSRDEESGAVQVHEKLPPSTTTSSVYDEKSLAKLAKPSSIFTWRALNYTVSTKCGPRLLLDNVSGYCKPGKLTAFVGPSGAGKSTLLSVLTRRQGKGQLTGDLMVNGKPVDDSFNSQIGYCQQADVHDETATVREALEFSALLRQPASVPESEKLSYVRYIISILDMEELQDALISCLSLEQKRRLSIGVELCAKPSLLLFLDEPTSGLDTQGAFNIINLLRKLTDSGQSILCTIHQASPQQFAMFDRILAVKPGGRTYYFGEIGEDASTVLGYFQRNGLEWESEKTVGDLLMDIGQDRADSQDWGDIWANSPESEAVLKEIEDIHKTRATSAVATTGSTRRSTYAASTFTQIRLLTTRTLKQYWRTPEYPYSRLYASFVHSLLNGLCYLQVGDSVADMQSRAFACFLVLMVVPEFVGAISMRFIANRSIWLERERPSRVYSHLSFSISQILPEIPFAIVNGIVFYLLFYYLVGLPTTWVAAYALLMTIAFHLFATSWGQWIAALSTSPTMAANLMPFFVIMCELFNGILRPQRQMPVIWKYTMYYLTPFTYWIGGMLSAVLQDVQVRCRAGEWHEFIPPAGETCGAYAAEWASKAPGYLRDMGARNVCEYCEFSNGNDYLVGLELGPDKIWKYCGIFLGFVGANYLIVCLLVWVASEKKWFRK